MLHNADVTTRPINRLMGIQLRLESLTCKGKIKFLSKRFQKGGTNIEVLEHRQWVLKHAAISSGCSATSSLNIVSNDIDIDTSISVFVVMILDIAIGSINK